MLKKLIKYDLKYLFMWCRYLWLIAFITAVLFVTLSSLSVRYDNTFLEVLSGFAMITLAIFNFLSQISVYIRCYKNFATDEAYLTFTLPVSRRALLLSKTIAALIEAFARYLFLALLALACIIFIPPYDTPKLFINTENLIEIREMVASAWSTLGAWLIVYVLLAILLIAICTILITSVVYLAITLGSNLSQKSKILVTIGILYLFNLLSSYVLPFALIIPAVTVIVPLVDMILALPNALMCAAWSVAGLLLCTVLAAITAIIYFINLGIIERKLNLQ